MNSPRFAFRNSSFRTLIAVTCVALSITCASAARAQSSSATLSGLVVDQNGAVVPGAEVRILNSLIGLQRQTTSNDQGAYRFPSLPPATYVVTATHQGFAPIEIQDIVLNVGAQ